MAIGAVGIANGSFENVSFDIPLEWQVGWENLSNNILSWWNDVTDDVSSWWNGIGQSTSVDSNVMSYERKTPAPSIRCKSRKEAEQGAHRKGEKRKPILNFNDPHGPHFHPDDPKFKHWHYFFGWLLWRIIGDDEYGW